MEKKVPTTTASQSHARQKSFLEEMRARLIDIKRDHPDWYAFYEDEDPMTSDRSTLEQMLADAPTEYAQGLITGIMAFRQQIAILTDRSF
jgi:hypothetical protein